MEALEDDQEPSGEFLYSSVCKEKSGVYSFTILLVMRMFTDSCLIPDMEEMVQEVMEGGLNTLRATRHLNGARAMTA